MLLKINCDNAKLSESSQRSEIMLHFRTVQITVNYTPEDLLNRNIVGCLNLGEKNIAGFISQFLLLGFSDENGTIRLVTTEPQVPNGQKMH